jgi:ferric-dicitrate binding protein FerR (iron transport regulator)
MSDHAGHTDDVGAYLLGALNDLERQAFERHLRGCDECQEELERLRPAAEALPGSVKQREPPPGLKKRLMAEVEPGPRRRTPTRSLLAAAAALVIALAVAFGVSQLGGDDTRTVTATVADAMPRAGGQLDIDGDHATLRLHDMPDLGRARVYQVWLQHGERMVPARTFEVGRSGTGDVRLPDVRKTDGVFVTREDSGGARVPSEDPIVSVPL